MFWWKNQDHRVRAIQLRLKSGTKQMNEQSEHGSTNFEVPFIFSYSITTFENQGPLKVFSEALRTDVSFLRSTNALSKVYVKNQMTVKPIIMYSQNFILHCSTSMRSMRNKPIEREI